MRFATKAIRVGQDPDAAHHAVIPPIYQSATFAWDDLTTVPVIDYGRCTSPNRIALEQALASLENARHCTIFSSGMAAITAAFSTLNAGDHLICASDIYGGTFRVCRDILPKQGIEVSTFDPGSPETLEAEIRPNTKLVCYESPSNPNLRVFDVEGIAHRCRSRRVLSVFDNTFASPALMNPLDFGVDIVVHSTTKYVTGHSDVVGGALLTNRDELHEWVAHYSKSTGAIPSPFDCWLSLRGLKTLDLRMSRHCENAMRVATHLSGHPAVARVWYPGLPDNPGHDLAKRQMRGFGGMVAFEVAGGEEAAQVVAANLRVFLLAESLGGVESLVAYPKLMSHASLTEEQRVERGIPPNMLRLSVGIEAVEDLIEDLDQALACVGARGVKAARA